MNSNLIKALFITSVLVLTGCSATGKYTQPAVQTNHVVKSDKAAIVFFRASSYGGAITSPLVEVDQDGNSTLVGILGPKEKMVKYVEPGEHTFMIVGENADFMKANVEAGKVYYGIIRPRMGIWKARFSLTPFKVKPEDDDFNLDGKNLVKWLKECKYTEPNDQAFAWHKTKNIELLELYKEYMPVWQRKSASQREAATLTIKDGKGAAL